MKKNIIQILKSGNQELFYSSLFAWLLDPEGDHGLGVSLRDWFLKKNNVDDQFVRIETEKNIDGGRADIFVTLSSGKFIVIENKTKSIGTNAQVNNFENNLTLVVPLGFIKENFPLEQRDEVITYQEILDQLKTVTLKDQDLSVIVKNLIVYLDSMLTPYRLFDDYCKGVIEIADVEKGINKNIQLTVNDNDRRFFQAVYFDRLLSYIKDNEPKLIFGEQYYYNEKKDKSKPSATRWIIEKNKQGPAFMESIIYF